MDLQKIGTFLSALRKEQGLTQEALGQMLGVTGKTISRWETGTYLPPVEMLLLLSRQYGITINELLSGEVLKDDAYKSAAERNLRTLIKTSPFTRKEKTLYFKRKWRREHLGFLIGNILIPPAFLICGLVRCSPVLIGVSILLGVCIAVVRYNAMMAYVEGHAFDGDGK